MSEPGWITNGELTNEWVRPPSKWDDQVELIAIYLYRAERAWAQDARWLDAGAAVRKDYLGRAWAVAGMCNFPNHTDTLNRLSPLCPCDMNPETSEGPEQECPIDGDGVMFVRYVRELEAIAGQAGETQGKAAWERANGTNGPFGWVDLAEDEKAAWRNAGQAEVRDGE